MRSLYGQHPDCRDISGCHSRSLLGRKLRKMKTDAVEETACFCKLSDPQAMSLHNPYECFRDPANRSLRVGACNPAIPSGEFLLHAVLKSAGRSIRQHPFYFFPRRGERSRTDGGCKNASRFREVLTDHGPPPAVGRNSRMPGSIEFRASIIRLGCQAASRKPMMALVSRNSAIAIGPHSRPLPDCL